MAQVLLGYTLHEASLPNDDLEQMHRLDLLENYILLLLSETNENEFALPSSPRNCSSIKNLAPSPTTSLGSKAVANKGSLSEPLTMNFPFIASKE